VSGDGTQDGIIQIHEFLAWLTAEKPQVQISKNPWDGNEAAACFFFFGESYGEMKIQNSPKRTSVIVRFVVLLFFYK
jgi:hypothetical protein